MSYLGAEPSSIPLINRGGGEYNTPATAAPYKPSTMLQDFLNSLPGSTAPKPLIVQGGGTYNYPEVYAAGASSSYTPPSRARADSKILLYVAGAAAAWLALGVGGRGRYVW